MFDLLYLMLSPSFVNKMYFGSLPFWTSGDLVSMFCRRILTIRKIPKNNEISEFTLKCGHNRILAAESWSLPYSIPLIDYSADQGLADALIRCFRDRTLYVCAIIESYSLYYLEMCGLPDSVFLS